MRPIPSPRAPTAAFVALLLIAAGCSDASTAPAASATIVIAPITTTVYASDVVAMRATVRDRTGTELPGAAVSWSVSDASIAEVAANGTLTALKGGAVRVHASFGEAAASYTLTIAPLKVLAVSVLPQALELSPGDITPVGVRLEGAGGRLVTGRAVTITSDNPAVASIDAAGRVRAVSAGTATIRATADGVSGTARVNVGLGATELNLNRLDGAPLPILVAADSVDYFGTREWHEVYVEGGTLQLSGGAQPRYAVSVRYVEYAVFTTNGQRTMIVRNITHEADRGVVSYDARGDLSMVSEIVSPLSHTAIPVSGGFQVRFRIPGDNQVLDLFYRREPR